MGVMNKVVIPALLLTSAAVHMRVWILLDELVANILGQKRKIADSCLGRLP